MKEYQIGEVFEFIRNGASIKQSDGKGGFPITRIETIWNQTIDEERFGYADIFNNSLNVYEKYLMKIGDILMTHINSPKHLGKCAMYEGKPEKLIHGMNLLCLRANEELSVPKYLKYYFNSMYFKIQLPKIANQSVNQASFSAGNLKKLKIPLPPLDQQKQIANILDIADAYRQKTKVLIEKYDALTQSLFLDMFGDPVTNPKGFNRSTCGKFIDYLADIGSNGANKVVAENLKMSDEEDYAIMIRTMNLNKNDFTNNLKYVSEEVYNFFKKSQIFGGEIIMNKIGSAGDFWIMPKLNKPVSLGLNQFVIRLKNMNTLYFYHFLSTDYGTLNIKSRCNGVATKSITKTAVRELPILVPPTKLQNQFADLVKAIEAQKALAQQELNKADELFNSLLQKAFKGELV